MVCSFSFGSARQPFCLDNRFLCQRQRSELTGPVFHATAAAKRQPNEDRQTRRIIACSGAETSNASSHNSSANANLILSAMGENGTRLAFVAGAEGIEPQPSVLETDALPVELYPCSRDQSAQMERP